MSKTISFEELTNPSSTQRTQLLWLIVGFLLVGLSIAAIVFVVLMRNRDNAPIASAIIVGDSTTETAFIEVRNESLDSDLVVLDVSASCSCTIVRVEPAIIGPQLVSKYPVRKTKPSVESIVTFLVADRRHHRTEVIQVYFRSSESIQNLRAFSKRQIEFR